MKNDWEKKATCSAYLSTIIKYFLEFAPSNGNGPTDPLHLFHLEDTSLLFLFISESVKVRFLPRVDSFSFAKNHMLFIVSKQCACSRRVRIEGHMNRFEYCHPDNNSDNDSFGSFSYLLQHNSVLIFILWRSVRKSTIILGMKKWRSW